MKTPLQDLWDDVMPQGGECPAPRPHAVAQRVNAALDAVPSERKRHMKQKLKVAAILAAAVLVLTSSAFAMARNWTVLDAFFGGSSELGQSLMNDHAYSIEDDNYALSVTSSLADGSTAYLMVTVDAKTPRAAETLMSDSFSNMRTWHFDFPQPEGASHMPSSSMGITEEQSLRTDTSRTWSMAIQVSTGTPESVSIRLDHMDEDKWLEVPLTPTRSVTVEIGAEGTGAGTLDHSAGGPVTVETVTLSSIGLKMDYTFPTATGEAQPVLLFLKKDGTLCSWSQMIDSSTLSGSRKSGETVTSVSRKYAFRTVQDLSELKAVVFEGIAYPLSGGKSYAVDTSAVPAPFQLPLMDRLSPGSAYAVPVRALCDALGASCYWDDAARSATVTFRDTTIVLTPGSPTAQVNGRTVELSDPPAMQNGTLAAGYEVFADAWQLDLCVAQEDWYKELYNNIWVVIP